MKIVQINAVNRIRSTGRFVMELSVYLKENNIDNYIAYSEGESSENSFQIGNTFGKKLHALFSRIFGLQAYFSKRATKKLLKNLDMINPDIVHLGNLHGNYINLEILLKYLANKDIATVITLHDCWFYTGKCTHYTIDNCYKWQSSCGECPRLKKDNPSWFFDRTKKMLNEKNEWFSQIPRLGVVGVSDWITGEARKSILNSALLITRIYNWIDLNTFKPIVVEKKINNYNLKDNFLILGVASEWSNRKGLQLFVELSKKISTNDRILLVGNIKEDVHLPKNIINIKETHDVNELVRIYSMSDIFINFSKEETFGKVSAEALACGTPVITNPFTANPELVNEKCGFVTVGFDDTIEAITTIKQKGKKAYSDECRAFAMKNFNMDDRISDYIKVYEELISI